MIFECQMCHAKTAADCTCINRQWAMPNIPYTAPLTEQRVREIVREEILAYCLYNIIDKPTNWWSE